MTLAELVAGYRPESWGGTRGCTWPGHACYLWALEPHTMLRLTEHMRQIGAWPGDPVVVDDGVVQDGHHRIVTAIGLRSFNLEIPVEPVC